MADNIGIYSTGNDSSIISLSIVQNSPGTTNQRSCIGLLNIELGTLLVRCANDKCTSGSNT